MEQPKIEVLREIEYLERAELNKLKKQVLGYGNFKRTAIKLEMPVTTLRDVINKKYGEPGTIEKIRRIFLAETTIES